MPPDLILYTAISILTYTTLASSFDSRSLPDLSLWPDDKNPSKEEIVSQRLCIPPPPPPPRPGHSQFWIHSHVDITDASVQQQPQRRKENFILTADTSRSKYYSCSNQLARRTQAADVFLCSLWHVPTIQNATTERANRILPKGKQSLQKGVITSNLSSSNTNPLKKTEALTHFIFPF